MRKKTCHLEKEVINGLKANQMRPEIEKHIAECPVCEEAVSVYKWMNQFKDIAWAAEITEKKLPEPKVLWNKAYSVRKPNKELMKKALRPLVYSRIFSYGVSVIALIYFFLFRFQDLKNFVQSSLLSALTQSSLSTITEMPSQWLLVFIIPVFIVFFSMLFCVLVSAFEKQKEMKSS